VLLPKVARFRQINVGRPMVHHDALEFPDEETVLLTQGRRLQDRVHEAELFSDHDCLLRRCRPEAIEGPDARHSLDLKRGAHH
jgi:hypothetical protein